MEFGSCRSTKDLSEDKFLVMNCDGMVTDSARTLDEAQVKADNEGCAIVIKVLRTCGNADLEEIVSLLGEEFEVVEEVED